MPAPDVLTGLSVANEGGFNPKQTKFGQTAFSSYHPAKGPRTLLTLKIAVSGQQRVHIDWEHTFRHANAKDSHIC